MRRTIQSVALVLALSVPGYAGIMQCPIVEPTPEPAPAAQGPTTDGEMSAGATADGITQNEAATTFVEVMLTLLALP